MFDLWIIFVISVYKIVMYFFVFFLCVVVVLVGVVFVVEEYFVVIGGYFGFVYQLQDDLFLVFGDVDRYGKDLFFDFCEGKEMVIVVYVRMIGYWLSIEFCFGIVDLMFLEVIDMWD